MPETNYNIIPIEQAPTARAEAAFNTDVNQALAIAEAPEPQVTAVEQTHAQAEATPSLPDQEQTPKPTHNTVKKAGAAVLGTVLGLGAVFGLNAAKDYREDKVAENNAATVELVEDYKDTGEVPEGKTAIVAENSGTANELAHEITSGEDTADLQNDLDLQANAQGDLGIQKGETFVVDTEDITKSAAEDLQPDPPHEQRNV